MIDVVLNEITGLSIVHDEAELEDAVAFEADAQTGASAIMLRTGQRRPLRALERSILDSMTDGAIAVITRIDGRIVASAKPILVRISG